MTRGTFVYVENDLCYQSTEFNGDMYLDGYGQDAVLALSQVKNDDDFIKAVVEFNKDHHNYPVDEVERYFETDVKYLHNLKQADYFSVWFSDYLYLINLGKAFTLTDVENHSIKIKENQIFILNFGKFMASFNQTEDGLELALTTERFESEIQHAIKLKEKLLNY